MSLTPTKINESRKMIVLTEDLNKLSEWNQMCRRIKPQVRGICWTCGATLWENESCPSMCVETHRPKYYEEAENGTQQNS